MSFPAHILLPLTGAVVLALAVLGSWLWPAPTPPSPSLTPPPIAAPVALEPPPPPPAPMPRPPRPAARPEPARPVQAAEPPRSEVAMPREPVREAPPPPPLPPPEVSAAPPTAERRLAPNGLMGLRARALGVAMKSVEKLERERDEARARGDEAEWQRLDEFIRKQQEAIANMRGKQAQLPLPQKVELPSE